jgi:transcriptional regulator of arginine metabolism
MTKASRQRRIAELLRTEEIGSQAALVARLRAEGERVTQATLSRDLVELGAVRQHGPDGPVYRLPEEPTDPDSHLHRMLVEFAQEITASGNLVVVRTPPGCAQPVARALDTSGFDGALATIAGDDTILVVCAPRVSGNQLATRLRQAASHPSQGAVR